MLTCRFLISIAIISMCSVPGSAQSWTEVRSKDFVVATDTGQGRDVALRFEQMRGIFGSIFHRATVNIPVPLTIIAFRNSDELKANGPTFNGKPIDVFGFFQKGDDRNHIVLDLSSDEKWPVVFHEYAHLLLNGNYPRTQLWFDEGFAEYFAATRIGKEVELGNAPPSAAELANSPALMPVVQLFAIANDSQTYNQRSHEQQLFYAESWLVVHWIFDNHKMGELGKYFDLVMNRKVPVADAIQQAFAMEPRQFDQVIASYARTGHREIARLPVPQTQDTSTYVTRKLTEPQAKALLADLHAHMSDRQQQAKVEFKQVLAAEPDNAIAHRGLGLEYLRDHDLAAATEHIRRAASIDDKDASAHYYHALLLNRDSLESMDEVRATQMSFELQKAVALDPSYADAYNLLALAQMSMRKPEAALASAKKAVELSPRNEQFIFNVAQIQATLGDVDKAQAILRLLQNSSDPAMAEKAIHALSTAGQMAKQQKLWAEQGIAGGDPTDPRWRPKETKPANTEPAAETTNEKPDLRKIEFLKGTLVAVDCPAGSGATVTVSSGAKIWRMKTTDRTRLLVMGAQQFSCDWRNVKVAVNYKTAGALVGDIVSLEFQ